MRPARFETILRDLYATAPGVTSVQTVKEAGYDRHPYGLVVTYVTGARVVLQVVAIAREDDDYSRPEEIVEGAAPAEVPVPELVDGGRVQLAAVDQHLAALVLNCGSKELASAEVYSARKEPGAVQYGVTFTWHDTSRILVYVVAAAPAGREMSKPFNVPAAA